MSYHSMPQSTFVVPFFFGGGGIKVVDVKEGTNTTMNSQTLKSFTMRMNHLKCEREKREGEGGVAVSVEGKMCCFRVKRTAKT